MTRQIAAFLLAVAVTIPGVAAAESRDAVLLTAGTVKRVDADQGVLVLESGRRLQIRVVMRDGEVVALRSLRPAETVFVAGTDLGYETDTARLDSR